MAIVNIVLGDCPRCEGLACFGNILIKNDTLHRACKKCNHRVRVALPSIRKKILYLDQSFFSSAFKENDKRAVKAVKLLNELASRQLLVAPYSNLHEDETHLWTGYGGKTANNLMEFIKQISRGSKFQTSYIVEETQIFKAFKAFCKKDSPDYSLNEREAILGAIHEWHNYVYITFDRYFGDIPLIKKNKEQAVKFLVSIFDNWVLSKLSFEQDIKLEIKAFCRKYMAEYQKSKAHISFGDVMVVLENPATSQCIPNLLNFLPDEMPVERKIQEIIQFFDSQYFSTIPSVWLTARIFASLKAKVKDGAFAKREEAINKLSGVFYDIQHIASYAPYCDAIFIDNQMANWVNHPSIGLTNRFGTKVFSLNTIEQFMLWLNKINDSMTEEHCKSLDRAYGASI